MRDIVLTTNAATAQIKAGYDEKLARIRLTEDQKIFLEERLSSASKNNEKVSFISNFATVLATKNLVELFTNNSNFKLVKSVDEEYTKLRLATENAEPGRDGDPIFIKRLREAMQSYEKHVSAIYDEGLLSDDPVLLNALYCRVYKSVDETLERIALAKHIGLAYSFNNDVLADMVASIVLPATDNAKAMSMAYEKVVESIRSVDRVLASKGQKDMEYTVDRIRDLADRLLSVYESMERAKDVVDSLLLEGLERTEGKSAAVLQAELDAVQTEHNSAEDELTNLDYGIRGLISSSMRRVIKRSRSKILEEFVDNPSVIKDMEVLDEVNNSLERLIKRVVCMPSELGLSTMDDVNAVVEGIKRVMGANVESFKSIKELRQKIAVLAEKKSIIGTELGRINEALGAHCRAVAKAQSKEESLGVDAKMLEAAIDNMAYKVFRVRLNFEQLHGSRIPPKYQTNKLLLRNWKNTEGINILNDIISS